jgi:hypothetical protein
MSVRNPRSVLTFVVAGLCGLAIACSKESDGTPTTPSPGGVASNVTAPALEAPSTDQQLDTLRPTLVVRNATSDQQGARTYEFQVSDSATFASTAASNIPGFAATTSQTGVAEGSDGKTRWTPSQDLQPTTVFHWRARAIQGTSTGPWSATGTFRSKLVGFNRDGELYDPLIHGETVGEIVGQANFIPGTGLQLPNGSSHVKYLLPQTISSGEFSMDVLGLRPNAPGDKSKVFGMQEGQGDFITNDYRVDIQYRGANGAPPNAIQWRVIYGDADDLDVRYEPDMAKRFASVLLLNPDTAYHWKFTWGPSIRLIVQEGSSGGPTLYDYGMDAHDGAYTPNPHYAYLGAPVGRSGNEAATIPGAIYRNVWISNRPRPATLGSAVR